MAICAAALLLGGCASSTTAPKPKTALEIREMQTRSFETTDQKMVMKSLLNVLQDEGFIVKTANVELGLLTAEKDVEVSGSAASSGSGVNTGTAIALGVVELALRLTVARDAPASTPSTPSSSNISEYGTQTRVRINFQVKVIDNKGAVMSVEQVEDPRFYQEFFAKVDKGLFITQEKL
jgi:hypothetical protein